MTETERELMYNSIAIVEDTYERLHELRESFDVQPFSSEQFIFEVGRIYEQLSTSMDVFWGLQRKMETEREQAETAELKETIYAEGK